MTEAAYPKWKGTGPMKPLEPYVSPISGKTIVPYRDSDAAPHVPVRDNRDNRDPLSNSIWDKEIPQALDEIRAKNGQPEKRPNSTKGYKLLRYQRELAMEQVRGR